MTYLKVILKGIMNPEDAEIAVDYCDAICSPTMKVDTEGENRQ